MHPDQLARAATVQAETLHGLMTKVMLNPAVVKANAGLLEFRLDQDDHEAAFLEATALRVKLMLEPRPVVKQSAVEADRAKWRERVQVERAAAAAAREREKIAVLSAAKLRSLGQEELALRDEEAAREAGAEAEGYERGAGVWSQMLASLPDPEDARVVKYLPGSAPVLVGLEDLGEWLSNPVPAVIARLGAEAHAEAAGTLVEMAKFFRKRFGRPCEAAVIAYTNALSFVPVNRDTRRRDVARSNPEQQSAPAARGRTGA
jgi:hypothetical protein